MAAVIFVSRVSTTRSDMGTGIELDVITAVVLGGTSIFGGRGTIIGTVLGLILIQALKNGLSLAGVKGDGTIVLIGAALILTILISNLVSGAAPAESGRPWGPAVNNGRRHQRRRDYASHDTGGITALSLSTSLVQAQSAWTGGDDLPTSPLACDGTPATAGRQAL
jgi:hypothetical protein